MSSFSTARTFALSFIATMAIILNMCQVASGRQTADFKETPDPYFQLPKPPLPKIRPQNREIDGWIQNAVPSKPTGVPLDSITMPIVENGSIIREKQKPNNDTAPTNIVENPAYKKDIQPPWENPSKNDPPAALQPIPSDNFGQRYGDMQLPRVSVPRPPQNSLMPISDAREKSINTPQVQTNEFVRPVQSDGMSPSNSPAMNRSNFGDFQPNKFTSEFSSQSDQGMAQPASHSNEFVPLTTSGDKTKSQVSQLNELKEKPANRIAPFEPLAPNDFAQPLKAPESKPAIQDVPDLSNNLSTTPQKTTLPNSTRAASFLNETIVDRSTSDHAAGQSARASLQAKEVAARATEPETFEQGRVLALVGGEPIFVGDVLFDINQFIQKVAPTAPESIREQQRPLLIKRMLPNFIDSKLLYVATVRGLPEQAKVEDILKQADKEFDEKALEKFMEQMNVKSTAELDAHLRLMGSSLRKLRRSWSKEQLVRFFLSQQLKVDTDVSHQEMLEYYQEHESEFTLTPRARWEQVMVRFDKFKTREEARRAIVEMGNKIVYGAKLSAVAKQSSHGFHAADGGQHDWTSKGALTLKELDKAIFETPIGTLSDIIETGDGFHIVRVLERDEATKKTFLDAQMEIKEKLVDEKRGEAFAKHLAELKQEIPVEIFDFDPADITIGQSQALAK